VPYWSTLCRAQIPIVELLSRSAMLCLLLIVPCHAEPVARMSHRLEKSCEYVDADGFSGCELFAGLDPCMAVKLLRIPDDRPRLYWMHRCVDQCETYAYLLALNSCAYDLYRLFLRTSRAVFTLIQRVGI
jgi:hypothetical protein